MSKKETKEKLYTCYDCKGKFLKEHLVYVNKSTKVCKSCNDKRIANPNEYKVLIDYICKGFNIDAPTGAQKKEIKRLHESGLSYNHIAYTLYYIFSVLGKKPQGTSIGLVSYYHVEALEHRKLVDKAKQSVESCNKLLNDPMVIRTNVELGRKPKIDKTRLIDIQKII